MIGKIKKGKSFGGCIRYVMGKDNAEIISSDGVLLGTNKEMIDSFNCQCHLNPRIKQPLGHIALSFKREDAPRLTDDFMAKIALEYMELMSIKNTQFILVRHHNTDNPHCHLVYNCILRDTKNGEDRLIPFDTTLSTVLKEYVIKRDKLPIRISLDSPFFVTLKGSRCNKDSIYRRFRKILQFAGIPKNNIRLHDLRHTFAVHSLAKMVESGMDLYCALPILSTYLGHKSYQATNNYVRLTEDIYPNLLEKVDAICFNVFPKI